MVSVAPWYTNLHSDQTLAPMTFTNIGRTCELFGDMPGVQPVSGPRHYPVGDATVDDLVARLPVALTPNQSSLSMLMVLPVAPSRKSLCKPVTTDGLVISDGLPYSSTIFVHYVLRNVCSDSATGNVGVGIFNKPLA